MKLRKNDIIKVIAGKDAGKESVVERVLNKSKKVYAKEVNVYKRTEKGKGVMEVVKPIDVSNVGFVCPKCNKVGRLGYRFEDNKKVRFCKQCNETV